MRPNIRNVRNFLSSKEGMLMKTPNRMITLDMELVKVMMRIVRINKMMVFRYKDLLIAVNFFFSL